EMQSLSLFEKSFQRKSTVFMDSNVHMAQNVLKWSKKSRPEFERRTETRDTGKYAQQEGEEYQ
ncbi:MAG: hypothetical protein IJU80_08485, partial [Lachnospiraceae bacterium]|nr:hypothetical protein [Lachnospiraceae bacterium]